MVRSAVLAVAIFALAPQLVGAQSAEPAMTSSPVRIVSVDGAFSLPGGVWKCETLANSTATSVYKLESAGKIVEHTKLVLPKRAPVELDATFVYDPARHLWNLSMQNGAYVATAPSWSTDTWTFTGTEANGGLKEAIRLVYTSLGDGAYRVDFQTRHQGSWQTFSGATCKRSIP
jgi:hypothetical protein